MATNLRRLVSTTAGPLRGVRRGPCFCRPIISAAETMSSNSTKRTNGSTSQSRFWSTTSTFRQGGSTRRTSSQYFDEYYPSTAGTSYRCGLSTVAAAPDASPSSTATASTTTSSLLSSLSSSSIDPLLQEAHIDRSYLESLALQRPTPLRLKDMYQYGTSTDPQQRLRNAQFLYKELPVRIAQRAIDLLTLPHGLSEAVPIRQVASIYLNLLSRFQEFPYPTLVEEEERFTDMLQSIILDRTSIPTSIAQGVKGWWNKQEQQQQQHGKDTTTNHCSDAEILQEMEEALYRFFTARTGLRFLTEHFVLSSNRESATALRSVTNMFPPSDTTAATNHNVRGCIQANIDVVQEIRRVADVVTHQTKEYYGGLCPVIDIVDCMSEHEFTHVPHHLHFMISELLKNSCRASVRKYKERQAAGDTTFQIPKIRVIVVKGDEDVTIKVADQGGGIPRSLVATIWKFAHSTANEDEQQAEFGVDVSSGAHIRGFGLPLARIYARYFGGELTLKSTEGYGLDAYLHLPRLGDACENLPLRVRDSPGEQDSMPLPKTTLTTTMTKSSPRGTRTFSTAQQSVNATDQDDRTSRMGALEMLSTKWRSARDSSFL